MTSKKLLRLLSLMFAAAGLSQACGGDEAFYDDNRNEIDDREEGPGVDRTATETEAKALTSGGGRVSGLYCGDGQNGHTIGTLYRYSSATQSFTPELCCQYGCGVNAAGVNDACRAAPTAFETNLAARARASVGASRASIMTGNAARGGTTWQTDAAGGDGDAMRLAIRDYHGWPGSRNAQGAPTHAAPPPDVLTAMKNRLSNYNATDKTSITNRIIAVYTGGVPADPQATLTYLGVRAQCKETVDRWVQDQGGTSRTYAGYNARLVAAGQYSTYTEGKGVTVNNTTHIAVVTRVNRDAVGRLLSIELTESNWGQGFSNPAGQVPWSRLTATRTVAAPLPASYRVFSF